MRRRDDAPSYDEADFGLRLLEDELRSQRPAASAALTASIVAGLAPQRTPRRRPQSAFAVALTLGLASALAWVGGVSYAASAVTHAAGAAKSIVVTRVHVVGAGITAGGDQYKPGYGFGDQNHNHDGPPGIADGKPGQKSPPTQAAPAPDKKAVLTSAQITVDEQAALYFSVLDAKGNQLLLTQRGSTIGGKVDGAQVKTIHYVMLVPRTIPVQIRVPANLLAKGETYRIRIIAVDAQGNKTRTFISFTA
ncbi:MAG TPA: hypothetical protein VGO39_10155 [Gaiellaceae bacterium]|jgi:hypothetical protein|nr:hypothetical protein [Gaiellaceae bacterium]